MNAKKSNSSEKVIEITLIKSLIGTNQTHRKIIKGLGLNWRGTWDPEIFYAINDMVYHNGSTYVAIFGTNNQGVNPEFYLDEFWAKTAAMGLQGIKGEIS